MMMVNFNLLLNTSHLCLSKANNTSKFQVKNFKNTYTLQNYQNHIHLHKQNKQIRKENSCIIIELHHTIESDTLYIGNT